MTDQSSAREQIADVLLRYATAIDTRQWALLRTCFTDDVQADYGDIGHWSDADGITKFMSEVHETMSDVKHMLHNMVIRLDDDNHATFKEAEAYPPLNYSKRGATIDLAFWRAPERLFDEPDEFLAWARAALAATRRVAAKRERAGPVKKIKRSKT